MTALCVICGLLVIGVVELLLKNHDDDDDWPDGIFVG